MNLIVLPLNIYKLTHLPLTYFLFYQNQLSLPHNLWLKKNQMTKDPKNDTKHFFYCIF